MINNLDPNKQFKMINNLDPNKVHGHDMLSTWTINLCENSICKPLSIIFIDCLKEGIAVPAHKKGDKHCLKK